MTIIIIYLFNNRKSQTRNVLHTRESWSPKIPGGNWEFPGISDILGGELRGIYRNFVFFSIFIVDYDILAFNLTHYIMGNFFATSAHHW